MSQTLTYRLFRCWRIGMGLRATTTAIARDLGLSIEREAVRRAFVEFADDAAAHLKFCA